MQSTNPYRSPSTDPVPAHGATGGSIESALAGESQWEIAQVMSEAWQILSGFKGAYWGGLILYFLIQFSIGFAFAMVGGDAPEVVFAGEMLAALVTMPILAGLYMLAIRHSVELPVDVSLVFTYFERMIPLFVLFVLISVLTSLGFVLLVLPGVYLAVAYFLAVPLMVEKNLGLWEAMETSRKAITRCWFRMFGLLVALFVVVVISAIPLGIGLIWALPWSMLAIGLVYREMFGVEPTGE